MTWGPALQVGFGDIDAQHKRLVELVNELNDEMRAGSGRDAVGPVLTELVRYTVDHFAFEERLMQEHDISTSAAHLDEHRQLVAQVASFKEDYEAGSAAVSVELMTFLRKWLTGHILKSDKALARELKQKGAVSSVQGAVV
ncbi:MAG: bacteriohemerythrin [Actinomycetota bacterium]